MCLNNFGYSAAGESSAMLADDFVLTQRTMVASLVLYAYETFASAVSVTGASATIHSAQPSTVGQHALYSTATVLQPTEFTNVYRQSDGDAGCTRRLQRIVLNLNNIALNSGTYWVSFQLTGGAFSGPFVPPVTLLGAPGKPGANSLFSSSGGAFQPVVDTGSSGCSPPVPSPNPQDVVFAVEGRLDLVRPCCNTDGSCSMVFESACMAGGGNPGPIGSSCNDPADFDSDGAPDVCDLDDDGDGVPDAVDVCPRNAVQLVTDAVSGRPLGDTNGDCLLDGDDIAGFVQQLLAGN
ncbi:MAG: thrombospondin type 3 repeat-containing protein [Planctomycetes bacterium]|nr:thrombospondin type 3 repeat-containing protein [Planctomycetota bacterium]